MEQHWPPWSVQGILGLKVGEGGCHDESPSSGDEKELPELHIPPSRFPQP